MLPIAALCCTHSSFLESSGCSAVSTVPANRTRSIFGGRRPCIVTNPHRRLVSWQRPYAAIGIAAPLVIVLARLLQGFATGGEFSCATTFLVEIAPPHLRCFYGSWQMFGLGTAVLTGTLMGALVTRGLTPKALESWGWRIPFLFGLIIGPVGLYIRRHLDETLDFVTMRGAPTESHAFGTTLVAHFKEMVVCLGLSGGPSIPLMNPVG
jgi:MFS transporter, MHS family, proline/betaine transporter